MGEIYNFVPIQGQREDEATAINNQKGEEGDVF